jgi:hypothetical protein
MAVSTFLVGNTDPEVYSMTDGVKRADANIPLGEAIGWAERDPIWTARGKAIQAYAELESALCSLMAATGETSRETALAIFYKITNTHARNSIIEKLLHKKCGPKFNPFWNKYVRELRKIDLKRNEIVHWLAAANVTINADHVMLVGVTLIPPASLVAPVTSPPRITTKELNGFEEKCGDFARLANMFAVRIKPLEAAPEEPWLDIFQLPFVYPLPEGHPIARKPATPDTPPQSSPA